MSISISEQIEENYTQWTIGQLAKGADEPREDIDDSPAIREWREEAVQAAISDPKLTDVVKWSLSLSREADLLLAELPREEREEEVKHPARCPIAFEELRLIEKHCTEDGWRIALALDGLSERNLSEEECNDFIQRVLDDEERRRKIAGG